MTKEQRTMLYAILGVKIKTIRTSKHMSQDNLAKKVGLTRTSIVNIEVGRQQPPLHVIFDIAEALNTRCTYFLTSLK